MPTLRLEYTDNLKIQNKLQLFFKIIHAELVNLIKTDLDTCRSLVTAYSDYCVGNGSPENAFIQITIHILPGRSEELRKKLGAALFEKLNTYFHEEIARLKTQVRVYVQETDLAHYHGLPL